MADTRRPFTKQRSKNIFEVYPKKYDKEGKLRSKDMGDDLPMSRESSPIVTDIETGETTFGTPQNFSCGGMGKAVRGGKYIGCK